MNLMPAGITLSADAARFLSRFTVDSNGCWGWTGSLSDGYGRFMAGGVRQKAHRWILMSIGVPVDGLTVDHLCGNRSCVNPQHLEAVTLRENIRRADPGRRGREKTHCVNGHEFVGANVIKRAAGRGCRACQKSHAKLSRARQGSGLTVHSSKRTHCPSGHEYTEKNTYTRSNGHRVCRACINARSNASRR